tara:strand:+ start:102 stop:227 length:126 start_codon:yes stop_codon:yes gene_type:complete
LIAKSNFTKTLYKIDSDFEALRKKAMLKEQEFLSEQQDVAK